jgi:hypothetical protein
VRPNSFDEDAYYYQQGGSSSSGGKRGRSRSRNEEGEDLLEGVPSLSGKSSLSKGVNRDRALTVNKLGIAGGCLFDCGVLCLTELMRVTV